MVAYRTVMVGTDGSESSFAAVEGAARLAAVCEAELVIACAYAPMRGPELSRATDQLGAEAFQVVGSAPAEDTLRIARDRARAQGAVHVRSVAVEDEPVAALVRTARECSADLLVVGNRGLRSLAGRILGSVPADVARRAGLDVLIVHTT
ncbi:MULTISPECIES: universal stress protein [unclassified Streptomyces]|uniref:universal stress protein n=1 Tax=Streptomyces TaxID=1883 RepID=UPI0001C1CA6C|nr:MULTISPECIES: universal stress protein [unclassified Streptomyces]MYR65301.1 universal stress protein [Streptomyces sp. SID4939]MYS00639.1 universal stress protein [Streptomyces sp. SID4940]MYT67296.1 universal stress protein [Streptomyces sp. SID8357]MYT88018.1 universal stress protein [Streptomyces sp. SID8360]MYU32294.1 universal stress protein [Streptomyces sp. SID8358]MYW40704.1 universal stress protein [Streptomyces sp. SID1]